MTNYRRNFIAAGSFFFTVNLAERRLRLLTEHIDELRSALRQTRQNHINPVKHGLVPRVRDWPYSSFHRLVKLGICPEDWAGDVSNDGGNFGERP
jgi:putative transposase